MNTITRNKFLAAAVAGIITCGGAIATATVSNADPSASPGATSSTGTSTGTSPATATTTAPTSAPSTSTSAATSIETSSQVAHLVITPVLKSAGNERYRAGFQANGSIFGGKDAPLNYTSAEVTVDGKVALAGDGYDCTSDCMVKAWNDVTLSSDTIALAPGTHTVIAWLTYSTGPKSGARATATKVFTTGSGSTSTATTTQPPAGSSEPPTPSPRTTQLGVTG